MAKGEGNEPLLANGYAPDRSRDLEQGLESADSGLKIKFEG